MAEWRGSHAAISRQSVRPALWQTSAGRRIQLLPASWLVAAAGTVLLGCTHVADAARGRDCCMATSGEGRGGHVAAAPSLRRALHVERTATACISSRSCRLCSLSATCECDELPTSCRRAQPAPCAHSLQLHSRAVGLQQSAPGRSGSGISRLSVQRPAGRVDR